MNFIEPFMQLFVFAGIVGLTVYLKQDLLQLLSENKIKLIIFGIAFFLIATIWGTFPKSHINAVKQMYLVLLMGCLQLRAIEYISSRVFKSCTQ